MIGRAIVALLAGGLLATQVIRNAAVESFGARKPEILARFWPSHPTSEIASAMTEIARASRDRRPVPKNAFALMSEAAAREPLATEPYLVRGVQAELAGDGTLAQHAFQAAQWRDPRSLPAAYFLADRYFRTGDVVQGLTEVAALARLAPNGNVTVAPYLAAYSGNPANWPALRTLFRANPGLAQSALLAMASNLATVPAVMALADPHQKTQDAHWIPALINTLVAGGQYIKAREVWTRTVNERSRSGQLIYDASFSDKDALPPFNWALTSTGVGVAERQSGGRLHILFYGQEDGILASELLLLPKGEYRLSMQLRGDAARARLLNWSLWCDKADAPLSSVTIDAAASRGWKFTVPSGCEAQWLRLSGASGDLPQQADTTLTALKLERVNGNS